MQKEPDLLKSPAGKQWSKIGVKQHHGLVIPIFSLHQEHSCGIGEYLDLIPLFPWCKEIGMDVIQILPINDTGKETSPYSALSAYALNPIYLSLSQLPSINKFAELKSLLVDMQEMNSSQSINYHAVHDAKMDFLHKYYKLAAPEILKTTDFKNFIKDEPWLESYSLFKTLKMNHSCYSWETWEPELKDITKEQYSELLKQYSEDIAFHSFVQYLCFNQWQAVRQEAKRFKILLKGDIPILINRDSVDVWLNRRLFLMDSSAGAPPDMYAKEGQNWGFPIFNWPEIEKEEYLWWRERLRVANKLYDLYRIDHVVGFFRIWTIKSGDLAKNGKFLPENQAEWIPHGEKLMKMMLENSSMLPIGEDLGTVPPEVRQCLSKLGICGTKVMRWERKWHDEGKPFIKPEEYLTASMTTVSTHDSETLQLWWQNNPEEAKEYAEFKGWEYAPELKPEWQKEILADSHHTNSLFHINLLQEYLVLVPGLSWGKPEEERINLPGIVSEKNWTYRFKPTVEIIINSDELKKLIREVLSP